MASITITTAGGEDAAIAADMGAMLELGRSATLAEIKAKIIADFKRDLREFRATRAANLAREQAANPTVT